MDFLGLVEISNWLLILIALLTAGYFYFTWTFGYWKSRAINGPNPYIFLGTSFPMFTQGVAQMDSQNIKKYGDKCGTFEGRTPVLVVQDPEFLKQIFVKDSQSFLNRRTFEADEVNNSMLSNAKGEQWKVLRSTISPVFSTSKLKMMTKQMGECAKDLIEALDKVADTGKSAEMKEFAGCFTMDAIASTAFGLKVNSQVDKDSNFVKMAKKAFDTSEINPLVFVGFFFPPLFRLMKWLGVDLFNKNVREFFADVTRKTIDARKESGETRHDFIQLMINSHKEMESNKQEDKEHDKEFSDMYKGVSKRSLTDTEIIAQSVLFFLAGYDTTSSSVAFLLHNLALNPEIQEELSEEITSVAGDQDIDYNMLGQMPLLEMCCLESLRMYPPAVRTERTCNEDIVVQGIDIRKGVLIAIPINHIHYDPRIWPEPEKFKPGRFTPEEKAKHSSYDWLPFGAGPRNCVAMRLAMAEVKLAVAYLVRKFKFVRSLDTEVPISLSKFGILQPNNGIRLEIERRN